MTTIAVKDDTFDLLHHLKEEVHAPSFDVLLKQMVTVVKAQKRSFFGKFKNIPSFKREEFDRFD